jgi:hypothetical protein
MFTWHPDCRPGWFDKIFQACQGPTSFIAYERGLVIFEYSHVFRSGGSLMSWLFLKVQCGLSSRGHCVCSYCHQQLSYLYVLTVRRQCFWLSFGYLCMQWRHQWTWTSLPWTCTWSSWLTGWSLWPSGYGTGDPGSIPGTVLFLNLFYIFGDWGLNA